MPLLLPLNRSQLHCRQWQRRRGSWCKSLARPAAWQTPTTTHFEDFAAAAA